MTATVSLISNTASAADGINNPVVPLAAVQSYSIRGDGLAIVFEMPEGIQLVWEFATAAKCTAAKANIDLLVTPAQDIANA